MHACQLWCVCRAGMHRKKQPLEPTQDALPAGDVLPPTPQVSPAKNKSTTNKSTTKKSTSHATSTVSSRWAAV